MPNNRLPHRLTGRTVAFNGNGRSLGYPTANVAAVTDLADGIYFGFADLAVYRHQPCIVFIGIPTTVGDTERRVEAHLLDIADADYYGQELVLDIRYFERGNQTFATIAELQAAMRNDEAAARRWFAAHRL
jgi:riboflavin kinase/FMN adenylyltransferase